MSGPNLSKFTTAVNPDGKSAEISCWYVNRPFSMEEILLQIHRINPDVNLGEVNFIPGIVCFNIIVPINQIVSPKT